MLDIWQIVNNVIKVPKYDTYTIVELLFDNVTILELKKNLCNSFQPNY